MHPTRALTFALAGLAAAATACRAEIPHSSHGDPTQAYPSAAPSDGASALAEAQTLMAQGELEAAEAKLEALLADQPELGLGWLLLAYVERLQGDVAQARAALERAAAIDAVAAKARLQLGLLAASEGDLDAAFEDLLAAKASGGVDTTAVVADPNHAALAADPRYAELFPTPAQYADPFVEEVRAIHEWVGEAAGDQFGWIARNIGDVDGDGVFDLVASAPTHAAGAGKVYAYSGASGALLWTVEGPASGQLGTSVEAAWDVDGDGVPDVIAGAPGVDRALVYSGKDGALLLELGKDEGAGFGGSVCGAGDWDGDGRGDLLVAAPQAASGAGRVELVSGKDGAALAAWSGAAAGVNFGSTVGCSAPGGDPLLIVGAPSEGEGSRGRVHVFRERSDAPAFSIDAEASGASLGYMFVSVLGDVDGDGRDDVYASDWADAALGPRTGRVYVHSGATGERLHALGGEAAGDGFGIGVCDVGDVDGDGRADLLIGAWQHASAAPGGGKLYLVSGADGRELRTITGKVMGETLGFDTTGLGDVDGDGRSDYLVTSAWSSKAGGRAGRMWVLAG